MNEGRFIPRAKTETKTIHTPVSKCGERWSSPVRIRAPYKGVDLAYRILPPLGDPNQIEEFDKLFLDEIEGDIERVLVFCRKNSSKLSQKQKDNIETLLERATCYVECAGAIWDTWFHGFGTDHFSNIEPWPLGQAARSRINKLIEEGHIRDEIKYKKLVRAALINIRCAEEVAKKATIRDHNRERHDGRRYAQTDEGVSLEEVPDSPSSKKSDNALLIGGALALGLFAANKKK